MADRGFEDAAPEPREYLDLRAACGLGPRSLDGARIGLQNSLYATLMRDRAGHLIALGRVVGDGGLFAQITEIAVHPDHQGRGLGDLVLQRVLAWCRANLSEQCYLSLVSNAGLPPWYARHGFTVCPPEKPGMALSIPGADP